MKYAPYPRYKPSGVAWLGDVPEHWTVVAVKYRYAVQLGKMLQPRPESPHDVEVAYLKAQHVQRNMVHTEDLPSMWASSSDVHRYEVRPGDLLVCEGGDAGRAAVLGSIAAQTIIQNSLHRVRPRSGQSTKFLYYLLEHVASAGWFEVLRAYPNR